MFLLTMQRYDVFTVCANNLIKNCCFVFALLICINQKCHNLPENTYCVLLRERTNYARVHNFYTCCTCMMSKYEYVVQYDVLTFCAYFVHLQGGRGRPRPRCRVSGNDTEREMRDE